MYFASSILSNVEPEKLYVNPPAPSGKASVYGSALFKNGRLQIVAAFFISQKSVEW